MTKNRDLWILRVLVLVVLVCDLLLGDATAQGVDRIQLDSYLAKEPADASPDAVRQFRLLAESGFDPHFLGELLDVLHEERNYEVLEQLIAQIGSLDDPAARNPLLDELAQFAREIADEISTDGLAQLVRGYGIALFAAPYPNVVPSVKLDAFVMLSEDLLEKGDTEEQLEALYWLGRIAFADPRESDRVSMLIDEVQDKFKGSEYSPDDAEDLAAAIEWARRRVELGEAAKGRVLTLERIPQTKGKSVKELLAQLDALANSSETIPETSYLVTAISREMAPREVSLVLDHLLEHNPEYYRRVSMSCFRHREDAEDYISMALPTMLRHYGEAKPGGELKTMIVDTLNASVSALGNNSGFGSLAGQGPSLDAEQCTNIIDTLAAPISGESATTRLKIYSVLKHLYVRCPNEKTRILTAARRFRAFEMSATDTSEQTRSYAISLLDNIGR